MPAQWASLSDRHSRPYFNTGFLSRGFKKKGIFAPCRTKPAHSSCISSAFKNKPIKFSLKNNNFGEKPGVKRWLKRLITPTNEKQAAVNELRKLWKGENWRVILEKLSAVQGAPHPFINPSTVARLLEDGYQVKHMRERTLEQIHWIINYCKKNNSKEDYNHLLKESAMLSCSSEILSIQNPNPLNHLPIK